MTHFYNLQSDCDYNTFTRMMQTEVNDNWEKFQPKTNIMWLDYLLDKLINVVPYKNKRSQVHKKALREMKNIKSSVMEYPSALAYVLENGNPI